jgi:hypothetical protein
MIALEAIAASLRETEPKYEKSIRHRHYDSFGRDNHFVHRDRKTGFWLVYYMGKLGETRRIGMLSLSGKPKGGSQ